MWIFMNYAPKRQRALGKSRSPMRTRPAFNYKVACSLKVLSNIYE